mmetsp:Transcript_11252/g.19235  ORF Transcript_11252/g.19235 Transcript_11252/m.19235 type:complete len:224 (-) Transcript_11252:70-741(-)
MPISTSQIVFNAQLSDWKKAERDLSPAAVIDLCPESCKFSSLELLIRPDTKACKPTSVIALFERFNFDTLHRFLIPADKACSPSSLMPLFARESSFKFSAVRNNVAKDPNPVDEKIPFDDSSNSSRLLLFASPATIASKPASPRMLCERLSDFNELHLENPAAKADAPSKPMLISLRQSFSIQQLSDWNTSAKDLSPTSPVKYLPLKFSSDRLEQFIIPAAIT